MSEIDHLRSLPPCHPQLVESIITQIKSQGLFDDFRKSCLADIDTKSSYLNLKQRVEGYVNKFLSRQKWHSSLQKNQLRETLRKDINESGLLKSGLDHLVDQLVYSRVDRFIRPKVTSEIKDFLQLSDEPAPSAPQHAAYSNVPHAGQPPLPPAPPPDVDGAMLDMFGTVKPPAPPSPHGSDCSVDMSDCSMVGRDDEVPKLLVEPIPKASDSAMSMSIGGEEISNDPINDIEAPAKAEEATQKTVTPTDSLEEVSETGSLGSTPVCDEDLEKESETMLNQGTRTDFRGLFNENEKLNEQNAIEEGMVFEDTMEECVPDDQGTACDIATPTVDEEIASSQDDDFDEKSATPILDESVTYSQEVRDESPSRSSGLRVVYDTNSQAANSPPLSAEKELPSHHLHMGDPAEEATVDQAEKFPFDREVAEVVSDDLAVRVTAEEAPESVDLQGAGDMILESSVSPVDDPVIADAPVSEEMTVETGDTLVRDEVVDDSVDGGVQEAPIAQEPASPSPSEGEEPSEEPPEENLAPEPPVESFVPPEEAQIEPEVRQVLELENQKFEGSIEDSRSHEMCIYEGPSRSPVDDAVPAEEEQTSPDVKPLDAEVERQDVTSPVPLESDPQDQEPDENAGMMEPPAVPKEKDAPKKDSSSKDKESRHSSSSHKSSRDRHRHSSSRKSSSHRDEKSHRRDSRRDDSSKSKDSSRSRRDRDDDKDKSRKESSRKDDRRRDKDTERKDPKQTEKKSSEKSLKDGSEKKDSERRESDKDRVSSSHKRRSSKGSERHRDEDRKSEDRHSSRPKRNEDEAVDGTKGDEVADMEEKSPTFTTEEPAATESPENQAVDMETSPIEDPSVDEAEDADIGVDAKSIGDDDYSPAEDGAQRSPPKKRKLTPKNDRSKLDEAGPAPRDKPSPSKRGRRRSSAASITSQQSLETPETPDSPQPSKFGRQRKINPKYEDDGKLSALLFGK